MLPLQKQPSEDILNIHPLPQYSKVSIDFDGNLVVGAFFHGKSYTDDIFLIKKFRGSFFEKNQRVMHKTPVYYFSDIREKVRVLAKKFS